MPNEVGHMRRLSARADEGAIGRIRLEQDAVQRRRTGGCQGPVGPDDIGTERDVEPEVEGAVEIATDEGMQQAVSYAGGLDGIQDLLGRSDVMQHHGKPPLHGQLQMPLQEAALQDAGLGISGAMMVQAGLADGAGAVECVGQLLPCRRIGPPGVHA